MIEQEAQREYKGQLFQLYNLIAGNEIKKQFKAKYGYAPEKIIITGGGILIEPIKEKRDEISPCG